MRRLLRPTIALSLFAFGGQIIGFVAQVLTASLFGARAEMDAYLAALTLPTYVNAVLFSGLSYVFVPVFVEYRTQHDEQRAWAVAGNVITLYLMVMSGLLLGGLLCARPLLALTVPGLPEPTLALAAALARIAWPSAMLGGLLSLLVSLYHAHERFSWPGLVPLIGSVLNLAAIAVFGKTIGIYTLALAQLVSSVVQVVLLLRIVAGRFSLRLNLSEPGLREMLRLLLPLVVGALFAQADTPIERFVASGLPSGSISHLGYAARITTMVAVLLSGGIAVTFFPVMARHSANNDIPSLRHSLSLGLRSTWLLVAPVIALGVGLAYPLISAILERGAFTAQDSLALSTILRWYLLTAIGLTGGNITARGFYALKDTKTMSYIAVGEAALYALYVPWLGHRMGAVGVAMAMALYQNLSLAIQCSILWFRLGHPNLILLVASGLRITLPAVVAGVTGYLVASFITSSAWLALIGGGGVGGIVYVIGLIILRAEEWTTLLRIGQSWVAARLGRA